ncbi:MAG: dihydrofolate reductase family protein, partial [Nitrososphaerales archaeon]
GPEEDPTGGFKYGGWSVNYWDQMMGGAMGEAMTKPFDLLLGRKTYEIFAAHWPFVKEGPDIAAAEKLNGAKKYVVSKTLTKVGWENSTLINGDVVKQIRELKNQNGPEIQVHGSSNLLQTLLKNELLDEVRMWTFPVTVGGGKRLFGEGTVSAGWKVLDSKVSTTGVIMATYAPSGKIQIGSFQLANPTVAEVARREGMKSEK